MHKILSMDIQHIYNKTERYGQLYSDKRISENAIKSRMSYLKKQGILSHIRKGVYMPSDMQDKFRIACNAVDDGCIVYHAALEYYLLQTQEFNWLYVHSSSCFRTFEYMNESYIYKPVKFLLNPVLIDGDNPYPIRVTSLNQTIIDCLYNINLAGGLEELLYAISELDPEKISEDEMLHCLKLYNNKSLYQRAGFILHHYKDKLGLSDDFFDVCRKNIGNNTSYLVHPYHCNSYSKEWNLCIPDNVMKQNQKDAYYEI